VSHTTHQNVRAIEPLGKPRRLWACTDCGARAPLRELVKQTCSVAVGGAGTVGGVPSDAVAAVGATPESEGA
jgi:hypothetical protein